MPLGPKQAARLAAITNYISREMRFVYLQGVPTELRLGFVDLDFECSTVCPTLLGLMGIWQKRLGMMVEHRFQSTQPMSQLTWDTL